MSLALSDAVLRARTPGGITVSAFDARVRAACPPGVLDTTHFDTVRFPPPAAAIRAVDAAMADGSLAYTAYRGHPDVLAHVAGVASGLLGFSVDPASEIMLTAGTQSALFAALSAVGAAGKRVFIVTPEYLFDYKMAAFLGAAVTTVPLVVQDGLVRLDLDALRTTPGDVLLFSNPNNPTGGLYDQASLEAIARMALASDLTVIVDEFYARLIHPEGAMLHLAALPGMRERTVTLLGPSKTESYSGFRGGTAIGPSDVMQAMEEVLALTALRAPAYNQHALSAWMADDDTWLAARLVEFTALRAQTLAAFAQLGWVSVGEPHATAYVWVDVSALGLDDVVVAERLARDAAVLMSPGYQFGPGGAGHFRLCYARDETEWAAALDRMVAVLATLAYEVGLDA